jgi:hypothetical protein
VAETPCFGETPNTTNQFKGFKPESTEGFKIMVVDPNKLLDRIQREKAK